MNKRGQIFSMIAVLISALFVLLFSGTTHVALDKQVDISKNEVLRVDNFLVDLEYYMDTTIDRVSFETLDFTVSYLDTLDNYSNYTETFISCFTKGYFDEGGIVNCSATNENISFMERIRPVISNATEIYDVDITYTSPEVTFRQHDAYFIEVNASMRFIVNQTDMRWDIPIERSRLIDFTGITDPATVGTPYNRTIRYRPTGGGDLFSTGDFKGNTTIIADYIANGYYYRDSSGLSLVDTLEGKTLEATDEENDFGINSILPADFYQDNQTSMVLYHYTSNLTFTDPGRLIRFKDVTGINSSIILNQLYVLNDMRVTNTSLLLAVDDCCDASGCDPSCG